MAGLDLEPVPFYHEVHALRIVQRKPGTWDPTCMTRGNLHVLSTSHVPHLSSEGVDGVISIFYAYLFIFPSFSFKGTSIFKLSSSFKMDV